MSVLKRMFLWDVLQWTIYVTTAVLKSLIFSQSSSIWGNSCWWLPSYSIVFDFYLFNRPQIPWGNHYYIVCLNILNSCGRQKMKSNYNIYHHFWQCKNFTFVIMYVWTKNRCWWSFESCHNWLKHNLYHVLANVGYDVKAAVITNALPSLRTQLRHCLVYLSVFDSDPFPWILKKGINFDFYFNDYRKTGTQML